MRRRKNPRKIWHRHRIRKRKTKCKGKCKKERESPEARQKRNRSRRNTLRNGRGEIEGEKRKTNDEHGNSHRVKNCRIATRNERRRGRPIQLSTRIWTNPNSRERRRLRLQVLVNLNEKNTFKEKELLF